MKILLVWKLNTRFYFFSFRRDWLLIGNYISLVMCKFSKNICWTFARRFPLFMTIKFLLLRTYASFCYRWSLLPKFALSNRNMSQKWKKTELSGANLENATFANLLSSRVSTSFALNLLLSIYIFATYLLGANFISAYTFFRLVLKQQL